MHRTITSLFLICSLCLLSSFPLREAEATSGRRTLSCSKTISLPSGAFIYKNSAPLRKGGVGTPLVGYRKEPTLICNTRSCQRSTVSVYARNGVKIGSCPWASAEGHSGGRYRCTMKTASLRQAAKRNGSTKAIFKINGSTCVTVPDAGRCYGSTKGLCGSTIG
jgi:hypothetical protein